MQTKPSSEIIYLTRRFHKLPTCSLARRSYKLQNMTIMLFIILTWLFVTVVSPTTTSPGGRICIPRPRLIATPDRCTMFGIESPTLRRYLSRSDSDFGINFDNAFYAHKNVPNKNYWVRRDRRNPRRIREEEKTNNSLASVLQRQSGTKNFFIVFNEYVHSMNGIIILYEYEND